MKNKKSIYILLPTVLFIWGAVMYQFFSFSNVEEPKTISDNDFAIKPLIIAKRDTFSIQVNYRDPFLGKIVDSQKNDSVKKIKKVIPKKIVEPIVWPRITYKGIVSDTKEKARVFMIVINGKTFLMQKGSIENDVFLKEGDKTSVYLKYKGELNLIMLGE